MTTIMNFGALNKQTRCYVLPNEANKNTEYECPDCNRDLIFCKGEINRPYFRHKVENDPCVYYSHPNESQTHKEAKYLIKNSIENKVKITFTRSCNCCNKIEDFIIPELKDNDKVKMEYRFNFNEGIKVADVAVVNEDNIKFIVEICHTHKTNSNDRPEPFYEIDASTTIKEINNIKNNNIKIKCIRWKKCLDCKNKEFLKDTENCFDCDGNSKKFLKDIENDRYTFFTRKISFLDFVFPKETIVIPLSNNKIDMTTCLLIDCNNNFTEDEKKVINDYSIFNVEDVIRHNKITNYDKSRTIKCFHYVKMKFELAGFEPPNGHINIKMEKYLINVRILPTGIIKYCVSAGEKNHEDFIKIGIDCK